MNGKKIALTVKFYFKIIIAVIWRKIGINFHGWQGMKEDAAPLRNRYHIATNFKGQDMEKLRYWNFLGEVFELEEAWVKCLELEGQAAHLLSRLRSRPLAEAAEAELLAADLRGFLGALSRELRSVTPRPPAVPVGWLPEMDSGRTGRRREVHR